MKAYHFLRDDMRAGEGSEPPWEIGETRTIAKADLSSIALCQFGYHASPSLWDALQYAPGPMACLVDVPPKAIAQDVTKSVHARRTLLKAVNINRELRLFAADCAERVLYIFERDHPNDDRPRAARAAAEAAARAAAQAAAEAAARAAARAAAQAAARAAAQAAAEAAAEAAAWDAETKWQREHFDGMFGGIFK